MESASSLIKRVKQYYTLREDLLLVEKMPRPEIKTKSGLITADPVERFDSDKPRHVRVVQEAQGYYDMDNKFVKSPFPLGTILLVGSLATIKWQSDMFGIVSNTANRSIGLMTCNIENAFMVYKSEEEYNKAFEVAMVGE